jgi:asparagine synthetase B (glutamine-hydrolysing)
LAHLPGTGRLAPARKLQSYIPQANIPLPERLESYNSVYRQSLEEMFSSDLLSAVDVHLPSAWLKDAYDRADSGHFINRMLHLDLKFTLADNDLRKVNQMTEAAGVEVRYPLLDDEMVEFSGEVPPDWKVKGQYLRWFFKTALKGFLPDEIINKSKHGFGQAVRQRCCIVAGRLVPSRRLDRNFARKKPEISPLEVHDIFKAHPPLRQPQAHSRRSFIRADECAIVEDPEHLQELHN